MREGLRRRMRPDQRREQLLGVGADLFATHPYEDVLMEEVALRAGVSRALIYHYFPGKRDFFAAVFKRDSERLLAASQIDTAQPLESQVLSGLEAHLDYFEAHRHNILTVNRGALAGDATVQAIISDELATLRNRMLDATGLDGHAERLAALALHGWLAFVRAVCVEWLQDADASRDEIRDLCFQALAGVFAPHFALHQSGPK